MSELWEHQVELGAEYLDVLIEGLTRKGWGTSHHAMWFNATSHGCRAYPDRLRAVISLPHFTSFIPTEELLSFMKSLLDAARVARTAGHLGAESYDAILLNISGSRREAISSEMILEMQPEAQAKLVNKDMPLFRYLPEPYKHELLSATTSIDLAVSAAKRAGTPYASRSAPPRERGAAAVACRSAVGRGEVRKAKACLKPQAG